MRFKDILRNLNKLESKLDNAILFIDFVSNRYNLPIILLKDGSVIILFELSGIDYEGLSEGEKEQLSYYIEGAMEQLGTGYMLSNYLVRDKSAIIKLKENLDAPEIIQYIQSKKQEFWEDISKRAYTNKVFCSLRFWNPLKVEKGWKTLIDENKTFEFIKSQIDDRIDKLYQGFKSLENSLSRFGFKRIDKEKSFETIYRLINFSKPPKYREDLSLNAQLAQSHYVFSDGKLKINNKFVSIISIKYPPPGTVAMYLRRFYELNFKFILKQTFGFPDWQRLEAKQNFNKNIAASLSLIDKNSAIYLNELNEFQDKVKTEKKLPVYWNLSIYIEADNEEELKDKEFEVTTLLKEIGSFGLKEKNNFKNAFFALFPGHERLNVRKSLILTDNAGDLFSAYILHAGDEDPADYFLDRTNGVWAYNPFTSRENAWHMAITGPTGGGKSFLVNRILLSSLVFNPYFYVIDLSQSFTELFQLLKEELPEDTAILTISTTTTDFKFNPFLLDDPNKPVPEEQLNFCEGLLKLMIGSEIINRGNQIVIREALEVFFKEYAVLLRNNTAGVPIPPLNILIDIIEQLADTKDFANALRLWTKGRKGEMFNSGIDNLTTAKYCYFDIRDIESAQDEMVVIVYTIFNKIFKDVSNPGKRNVNKFLFLDEAHRYLRIPEFNTWTDLLIRTGRHYRLLVGLVTQSINDLINEEEWSKGIVTNLKQGFFFSGQKDIEKAFQKLGMTEYHIKELYAKMRPEKREVFYWSSGGLRRVLSPLTDMYSYFLATTDAKERHLRSLIKNIMDGNMKKTIEKCVEITKHTSNYRERVKALEKFIREEDPISEILTFEGKNER